MQRTLYLPKQLKEELERQARKRGYPLRIQIIFILSDYLKNKRCLHHQRNLVWQVRQGNTL